jgi:hypothetical protein
MLRRYSTAPAFGSSRSAVGGHRRDRRRAGRRQVGPAGRAASLKSDLAFALRCCTLGAGGEVTPVTGASRQSAAYMECESKRKPGRTVAVRPQRAPRSLGRRLLLCRDHEPQETTNGPRRSHSPRRRKDTASGHGGARHARTSTPRFVGTRPVHPSQAPRAVAVAGLPPSCSGGGSLASRLPAFTGRHPALLPARRKLLREPAARCGRHPRRRHAST